MWRSDRAEAEEVDCRQCETFIDAGKLQNAPPPVEAD
jgi:hypothetical protein